MEGKNEPGQHCCAHSVLRKTRIWLCNVIRLPTVNAATLYKRVTPSECNETEQEHHLEEKEKTELQQEQEELKTSEKQRHSTLLSKEDIQFYVDEETRMSGWERIKRAYTIDPFLEYTSAELYDLTLMMGASFALGFTYGGVPGLRFGKKRYIEKSQAVAYETRFHAVSDSYNAGSRGLVRYGIRWGWRVAVIATSFQLISTCMSLYRYKADMWNYATAAIATGAIYRCNFGIRGMIGGSVAGLIVGVPAGLSLLFMQKMSGENSLERAVRMRADYMIDFKQHLDSSQETNAEAIELMREWLEKKEKSQETKR